MALTDHGANAAAVHLDLAAAALGGLDVMEIVPQGAAGSDILDQTAAAVDIELCVVHGPVPGGEVGPVDRLDPVSEPGGLGVLGEDRHGHVRIQRAHLLQNGLQNGIVTGVAPAVGAADHHAVPGHLGAAVAAENLLIDM